MDKLNQNDITEFQKTILQNYHESGRTFPWRETSNPYEILVSEIMLQQTQTDRVVPKYLNWLSVFPTIETLASSSFSLVLEHWIGLGYNRRARFLHETSKIILEKYNGIFPSDPEELDSLPGIGPYTARAISTFAFGISNTFIETNIRAVYIFFFFPNKNDVPDKELLQRIAETVFHENPRIWYYALMDYGAALKKKVQNPNVKSRHYTKQSKFDGSLRQARGAILRYLDAEKESTLQIIAESGKLPYERVYKAAQALLNENLVCEINGIYRIS